MIVVAVEEVSKHSLVSRDVHGLQTVHALGAGLRQWQARPPVCTPLVVLNAPERTEGLQQRISFDKCKMNKVENVPS